MPRLNLLSGLRRHKGPEIRTLGRSELGFQPKKRSLQALPLLGPQGIAVHAHRDAVAELRTEVVSDAGIGLKRRIDNRYTRVLGFEERRNPIRWNPGIDRPRRGDDGRPPIAEHLSRETEGPVRHRMRIQPTTAAIGM